MRICSAVDINPRANEDIQSSLVLTSEKFEQDIQPFQSTKTSSSTHTSCPLCILQEQVTCWSSNSIHLLPKCLWHDQCKICCPVQILFTQNKGPTNLVSQVLITDSPRKIFECLSNSSNSDPLFAETLCLCTTYTTTMLFLSKEWSTQASERTGGYLLIISHVGCTSQLNVYLGIYLHIIKLILQLWSQVGRENREQKQTIVQLKWHTNDDLVWYQRFCPLHWKQRIEHKQSIVQQSSH